MLFLFKLALDTFKNEGIKGFFRGVGISVVTTATNKTPFFSPYLFIFFKIGTGPAFALFMTSYEAAKKQLSKYDVSPSAS